MGNNQAQIRTPYYDKYFGPDYFKTIGDDLGFNGRFCIEQPCAYYVPEPVPEPVLLPCFDANNYFQNQVQPLQLTNFQQATQQPQSFNMPPN